VPTPAQPPRPPAPPSAAPTAATTAYAPVTPTPTPAGGGGRKKGLLVGGGILAVAAIVGGALVLTGGDDDKKTTNDTSVQDTVATSTGDSTNPPVDTTVGSVPADVTTISHSVVQIVAVQEGSGIWTGSGTIVDPSGLILTNAHVVDNSDPTLMYDTLVVSLTDTADTPPTPTYIADVVAFDPSLDLAVIKVTSDLEGNPVDGLDLPALPLGNSDSIGLGDHIRILGYPGIGGETITFTDGNVSGFTSEAAVGDRAWVKTDATIAGGNSGGTAVNDAGELVAVPTQASAGTGGPITDCRVVQDTNGDNNIDENDSCIPIGGFINGLRPVNLGVALIDEGRLGNIIDTGPGTQPTPGDDFVLGPIRFSPDVNRDDNTPIGGEVDLLPSGSPFACAFFDWEGMADGVQWEAIWSVDGEINADYSTSQEWSGGDSGTNWWICAGDGETPLADGMYELILYVHGDSIASNTLWVGDQFADVTIDVSNGTSSEICYLQLSPAGAQNWGPDELGSEQTLMPGDVVSLVMVGDIYDVLASDCDLNTIVEVYDVDLTAGGPITLTD
jgi:S1-C subfamily serine protease